MSSRIETKTEQRRTYLPAAGHDWLLPLYDPIVKLLGGEPARKALLDQAGIRPGHRTLDIGCGTGSLAVLIKSVYTGVDVVGLDPDPKALARAIRKAKRAGFSIQFDEGFADELPYQNMSFDRVFSTFMFHHLEGPKKKNTLREVVRVLKPGGSFHMLDFSGPGSDADHSWMRLLHLSHRLKDNSVSRVLTLMSQAGLVHAKKVSNGSMFFGLIRTAFYQASVADRSPGNKASE